MSIFSSFSLSFILSHPFLVFHYSLSLSLFLVSSLSFQPRLFYLALSLASLLSVLHFLSHIQSSFALSFRLPLLSSSCFVLMPVSLLPTIPSFLSHLDLLSLPTSPVLCPVIVLCCLVGVFTYYTFPIAPPSSPVPRISLSLTPSSPVIHPRPRFTTL